MNFGIDEKKGELALAKLQNALQIDIESPVQKACYYLEGGSPLILSGYLAFNKLEAH